jgi:hypothetical protein
VKLLKNRFEENTFQTPRQKHHFMQGTNILKIVTDGSQMTVKQYFSVSVSSKKSLMNKTK